MYPQSQLPISDSVKSECVVTLIPNVPFINDTNKPAGLCVNDDHRWVGRVNCFNGLTLRAVYLHLVQWYWYTRQKQMNRMIMCMLGCECAALAEKETGKGLVEKADEALEVSAQKVEGTLRSVGGAAKSAVDSMLGRRPEE
jgi:hypothetical protein